MTQISAIVTAVGTPSLVRATAGSITGAWGTGQARAEGNLLVAVVTAGGTTASAAGLSTPSGWTQQVVASNTGTTANAWAAVYTLTASGGDAAPAFTATLSGTVAMTCTLLELAAAADNFPVDASGTYASGGSAATLSAMAVTAGSVTYPSGDYALAVFVQERAAGTNTWNAGSGWANLVNDQGTSSVLHTAIDVQANVASATAVTETGHWTTDTTAFGTAIIVAVAAQSAIRESFANGASTTVSAGGTTAPAAGTAEFWTAGSWSSFPVADNTVGSVPSGFHVCDPAAPSETIAVLNTSSGLVIRGADGTVPVAHASGFTIQNVISSGYLGNQLPDFVVPHSSGSTATDSANIRAALAAAGNSGGGRVIMQSGYYQGDTGQFHVPPNVTWYFQQGAQLVLNCTGGATVDAISVDLGAVIMGEGQGGATGTIQTGGSLSARTLISNTNHSSVQEWCFMNGMNVNVYSGASLAVAVVEQVGTWANSGIRDCVIDGGAVVAGIPLLRIAGNTASSPGDGPVYVEDSWIINSGGDCVLLTDAGQTGTSCEMWMRNCTVEHPASGYHNIHLSGVGSLLAVSLTGMHLENDTTVSAGTSAFVYVDGCASLLMDGITLYASPVTNKIGVWITSSANNGTVSLDQMTNVVGISPVIRDDSTGSTYSYTQAGTIHKYNGAGWNGACTGSLVLANDFVPSSQTVALASTAVDARNGTFVDVAALAAAVTVAAPLHPHAGQLLIFKFVQNGTGGFAVSWNAAFRVAPGAVSTTASKASTVGFRYDSSLSAWVQVFATTGV